MWSPSLDSRHHQPPILDIADEESTTEDIYSVSAASLPGDQGSPVSHTPLTNYSTAASVPLAEKRLQKKPSVWAFGRAPRNVYRMPITSKTAFGGRNSLDLEMRVIATDIGQIGRRARLTKPSRLSSVAPQSTSLRASTSQMRLSMVNLTVTGQPSGLRALTSPSQLALTPAEEGQVGRVLVSADGNILVTILKPNSLMVWETMSGKQIERGKVEGVKPSAIILSKSANTLIYGHIDNFSVVVFDVDRMQPTQALYCEPDGGPIDSNGFLPVRQVLALSPSEDLLAVLHVWHMVAVLNQEYRVFLTIWDMKTRATICTVPIPAQIARVTRTPTHSYGGADDFEILPYVAGNEAADSHFGVRFSPDELSVVVTVIQQAFQVDVLNKQVRRILSGDAHLLLKANAGPAGQFVFTSIVQDPDRPRQANTLRLWDVSSRSSAKALVHPCNILGSSLSADGRLVAVALTNGMLVLWDIATSRPLLRVTSGTNLTTEFGPCGFSPCGRFIISYHYDACRLWAVPKEYIARRRGSGDLRDELEWQKIGFQGRVVASPWAAQVTGTSGLPSVWV